MNRSDMDKLISSNYSKMRIMALKATYNNHDADDLLQDTCIKLIKKHDHYEKINGSTFLSFVKVVMRRAHLNRIRKVKRSAETKGLYDYYQYVTASSIGIDDFNLLYESLKRHLESDQEVQLVDMLIEGHTFESVSNYLNIPKPTVHSRHRKLRLRLKKVMT